MTKMQSVEDFRYGCKLLLHRADHGAADPDLVHYWGGYSFHQYAKWRWYFRYRQALLQVQHPRRYVELVQFKYEYVPPKAQQLKRLVDKKRAAKAKHTHYRNQIELARQHWNEIFPIEDHPDYIRAVKKLEEKKALIIDLESQIEALT